MTMVVRLFNKLRLFKGPRDDSGQSVLEFLILLPALVGMTVILVRLNTAIQTSIVNQQYARAHTLWLTFNSSEYPQVALPTNIRKRDFIDKRYNKMVIGVSENGAPPGGQEYFPEVIKMKISAVRNPADASDATNTEEPAERSTVRVRTNVSICTQSNYVVVGGTKLDLDPETLKEGFTPDMFDYCRSPLDG